MKIANNKRIVITSLTSVVLTETIYNIVQYKKCKKELTKALENHSDFICNCSMKIKKIRNKDLEAI